MIPVIVGAAVSLIGVVAVVFVIRRKSEDKKSRSMYSARRSQIEHKVRAARERTLAPHGRAEKPPEAPPPPAGSSIFAPATSAPQVYYEPSAYRPAPAAPAEVELPPQMPQGSPWEVGPTGPSPFGAPPEPVPGQYPPSQPPPAEPAYPAPAEPAYPPPGEPAYAPPGEPAYAPPAEPAYAPAPSEPVWTPAASAPPLEAAEPATPAASPGSWSVVSESKESATTSDDKPTKKQKKDPGSAAWQLASGNEPDAEDAEVVKGPGPVVAIAQYAVLVMGLVMVLIGLFVLIANLHPT